MYPADSTNPQSVPMQQQYSFHPPYYQPPAYAPPSEGSEHISYSKKPIEERLPNTGHLHQPQPYQKSYPPNMRAVSPRRAYPESSHGSYPQNYPYVESAPGSRIEPQPPSSRIDSQALWEKFKAFLVFTPKYDPQSIQVQFELFDWFMVASEVLNDWDSIGEELLRMLQSSKDALRCRNHRYIDENPMRQGRPRTPSRRPEMNTRYPSRGGRIDPDYPRLPSRPKRMDADYFGRDCDSSQADSYGQRLAYTQRDAYSGPGGAYIDHNNLADTRGGTHQREIYDKRNFPPNEPSDYQQGYEPEGRGFRSPPQRYANAQYPHNADYRNSPNPFMPKASAQSMTQPQIKSQGALERLPSVSDLSARGQKSATAQNPLDDVVSANEATLNRLKSETPPTTAPSHSRQASKGACVMLLREITLFYDNTQHVHQLLELSKDPFKTWTFEGFPHSDLIREWVNVANSLVIDYPARVPGLISCTPEHQVQLAILVAKTNSAWETVREVSPQQVKEIPEFAVSRMSVISNILGSSEPLFVIIQRINKGPGETQVIDIEQRVGSFVCIALTDAPQNSKPAISFGQQQHLVWTVNRTWIAQYEVSTIPKVVLSDDEIKDGLLLMVGYE
eukprot:Gregarina_sp_Poly_1__7196@NODE_394_length_8954_cov_220_544278_g323_i0_p2_GENE_NODE_394_length_8954_cov_220_544278_g323_i0NODE_394_length_8954_cov_220_544278_g323_i0_p2_ORF_typecomplete_len617_score59_11_NODE_394_length_8954_cov_220_544278_g323_i011763026